MSLEDELRRYFGPELLVRAAPLHFGLPDLWPEERALVERAVEKRQREFAAGRVLARQILAELGFPPAPLLVGPERAPRWPAGALGSISHTHGLCVVVAGRTGAVQSVGLDVEVASPLEPTLWPMILRPGERAWLQAQPAGEQGRLSKLFFSAKEALYKLQHPFTGQLLGFDEVELTFDDAGGFQAEVLPATARARLPTPLTGRVFAAGGYYASAMRLPGA